MCFASWCVTGQITLLLEDIWAILSSIFLSFFPECEMHAACYISCGAELYSTRSKSETKPHVLSWPGDNHNTTVCMQFYWVFMIVLPHLTDGHLVFWYSCTGLSLQIVLVCSSSSDSTLLWPHLYDTKTLMSQISHVTYFLEQMMVFLNHSGAGLFFPPSWNAVNHSSAINLSYLHEVYNVHILVKLFLERRWFNFWSFSCSF